MKSIQTIQKNRDGLREACIKIGTEMKRIRSEHGNIKEMGVQARQRYFKLASLRSVYMSQVLTLDFVLREEVDLDTQNTVELYQGLEEFMYEQRA
jgi:hypothetical protein